MSETIQKEKREWREKMKAEAAAITGDLRGAFSMAAAYILLQQPTWRDAETILGYLPLKDELNLFPCLQHALAEEKKVALPRWAPDESRYCVALAEGQLVPGAFGIAEPPASAPTVLLKPLDLVLVPGLAFDSCGRRLGRGKGFYDRLLSELTGVKCGVALDEQIVARLPAEAHDIKMNFILTPTRWISVRAGDS